MIHIRTYRGEETRTDVKTGYCYTFHRADYLIPSADCERRLNNLWLLARRFLSRYSRKLEQDPDCTCENPTAGATLRCDTAANNEGYAVFTRVIRSLGEQ